MGVVRKARSGLALALLMPVVLWLAASGAQAGEALVTPGWLATRLATPGLVVLDVRPASDYARAHIAGAISLPLDGEGWLETRYHVPNLLPPPEVLAGVLGRAGISDASEIVVVSGAATVGERAAGARAYWSLRALGHGTHHGQLHLLDGDVRAFPGLTRAMSAAPRAAVPYRPVPDLSVLASASDVEDALDNNSLPIDARSRDAFEGHEVSPLVAESGTILDAINLPADVLLDEAGRFLPPAQVPVRLSKVLGATRKRQRVVFSDTGLRAAIVWFALEELYDAGPARLYDGSLAHWTHEGRDMYDSTDGMGGVIGG